MATAEAAPQAEQITPTETHTDIYHSLSLDAVEAMRHAQRDAYTRAQMSALQAGKSIEDARVSAEAAATKVKVEAMSSLIQSDAEEARRASLELLLDTYSYLNTSDDDWYISKRDQDGHEVAPSGMQQFLDDRRELFGTAEVGNNEAEQKEITEEDTEVLKEWHEELDSLRDTVSSLAAKRHTKLFGRGAKLLGLGAKTYDAAFEEYSEHVIAVGKLEVENRLLQHADLSDEDKATEQNMAVIEFLFAEQQKLREETNEKLSNTNVSKVIAWMNRGNIAQRILKGSVIGLGAGLAGAGIGALAGVAGAAAATTTIAAAVVAGTRFARGFGAVDAAQGRGIDKLEDAEVEALHDHAEEESAVTRVQKILSDRFENDSREQQRRRRTSVAAGMAGVALGGTIGIIVGQIADAATSAGATAQGPASPTLPDRIDVAAPETPAPQVPDRIDFVPEAPPEPEIVADPSFEIRSGEGGISLFQRIGLTESQWYEAQNDLRARFPNEFYQNPGEAVRIMRPGPLSLEAQAYIQERFGL